MSRRSVSVSSDRSSGERRWSLPRAGPTSSFMRKANVDERFVRDAVNQTLSEYITTVFGSGKSEYENIFCYILLKNGKLSLRLLVTYIILYWHIAAVLVYNSTIRVIDKIIVRCEVPELEGHFNFTSIIDISVKDRHYRRRVVVEYCKYDDRNYTALLIQNSYDYDRIMASIRAEPESPKQKPCSKFKIFHRETARFGRVKHHSLIKDMEECGFYCQNTFWTNAYPFIPPLGICVSSLLLGVGADIFGRKPAFVIGALFHLTGLVMLLKLHSGVFLFATFLVEFGVITNYILYILEMSSKVTLLWMGQLMFFMDPISGFIAYGLNRVMEQWRYQILSNISMFLILPFAIWYLNESARWLMFTGSQTKAWKVLIDSEAPVPDTFLNESTNTYSRRATYKKICWYFSQALFQDRVIMCVLLFFLFAVTRSIEMAMYRSIYFDTEKFDFIESSFETVALAVGYFTTIRYGRKPVAFGSYCLLMLIDCFIFMKSRYLHSRNFLVALLHCHMAIARVIKQALVLYIIELFPTPCRSTVLGISIAAYICGSLIHQNVSDLIDSHSKALTYMPAFISTVTSTLVICLLPKTRNDGLPDTSREALYLKDLQ